LARSSFGASAAINMPTIITIGVCVLMAILEGLASKGMFVSIVPGGTDPCQRLSRRQMRNHPALGSS
jgi:hypothetical protein